MFESPGSIVAFLCATFPFMILWMYERINNMFIAYGPDAEYFALKFVWLITKLYTYSQRRLCKMADDVSKMLKITSSKNLLLIKDGSIVQKIQFEKMNEITEDQDYDMVLLEYCVDDSNMASKYKTHMIRTTLVEEVTDNFNVCDTSFIGINVTIKEGNNVVNTETIIFGSENYYIVGNILFDRDFIKYWMMRVKQFEMTDTQTYEVSFFDNTVTPHEVKEPEYVQITTNGFDVIRPNILVKENNEENQENESSMHETDETEWEVEPENNLNSYAQEKPKMPQGNFLHSYFKGNTNWSQMFKSKNQ